MEKDLSLDEIAKRITNAIMNEPYFDRDSLNGIIKPILKIWLKKTDSFKSQKAPKSRLQETIENRQIQLKFWYNKTKELVNEDTMKSYYKELDEILVNEGYKQPSNF